MPLNRLMCAAAILPVCAGFAAGGTIASNLRADFRCGQVFLTWDEPPAWQGNFTILSSPRPITSANAGQAKVLADRVKPGSAYDWWLNPETFGSPLKEDPATGKKPEIQRQGFIIKQGAPRLLPDSGLFVHTVAQDEAGPRYYAVIAADGEGRENESILAGANSLAGPVIQKCEPVEPIWQESGAPPAAPAESLPLHLVLHAKTGRGGMHYLAFGDTSLGWREGLPFKFGVEVTSNAIVVAPTDRTWSDRMFPEGRDRCQTLTPAIHSFWYGYNSHINDPKRMSEGIATNYTERRLLWILAWVKRAFRIDPNRVYARGGSMGGCGSISFALRHPEIFAGIRAHVPIVSYDKGPGGDSEFRIVAECGPLDRPCSDGVSLRERLDGTRFVRGAKGDLPFLFIANGRQDGSIPWWKCPDFYRALRDGRHGFVAAWDNENHGTCMKDMPEDMKKWTGLTGFHHIALNKSYLAFSNSSADQDPGNGSKTDGDLVGFMNRGLSWGEPVDETNRYEALVKYDLEASGLPVTVDVTPRRMQSFRLKPGQAASAVNIRADTLEEIQRKSLVADDGGLVTFDRFRITSPAGNKLILSRPE